MPCPPDTSNECVCPVVCNAEASTAEGEVEERRGRGSGAVLSCDMLLLSS